MGSPEDGSVVTWGEVLKFSTGPQGAGTVALSCDRVRWKGACDSEGKSSGIGPGALCERSSWFLSFHLELQESVVQGLRLRMLHCFLFWVLVATFTSPHFAHPFRLFSCFSVTCRPLRGFLALKHSVFPSNASCECLDGKRPSLSFGDGDLQASVHLGSNGYEALGEGLQDHLKDLR